MREHFRHQFVYGILFFLPAFPAAATADTRALKRQVREDVETRVTQAIAEFMNVPIGKVGGMAKFSTEIELGDADIDLRPARVRRVTLSLQFTDLSASGSTPAATLTEYIRQEFLQNGYSSSLDSAREMGQPFFEILLQPIVIAKEKPFAIVTLQNNLQIIVLVGMVALLAIMVFFQWRRATAYLRAAKSFTPNFPGEPAFELPVSPGELTGPDGNSMSDSFVDDVPIGPLDPAVIALAELPLDDAVAILKGFDEKPRRQIIRQLPVNQAIRRQLLLRLG